MKKRFVILLVLLLVVAAETTVVQTQTTKNESAQTQAKPPITLHLKLLQLGESYDKFFTIEGVSGSPSRPEDILGLESKPLPQSLPQQDLFQELEDIRRILPQIHYFPNEQNPRVIHIIDSRLVGKTPYGLDQKIGSLKFEGTVSKFLDKITKQNPLVMRTPGCFTPCFVDYGTKVSVTAENIKVRDVLTNFVDLDNRSSSVLWIANTSLEPRVIAHVDYYGYSIAKQ